MQSEPDHAAGHEALTLSTRTWLLLAGGAVVVGIAVFKSPELAATITSAGETVASVAEVAAGYVKNVFARGNKLSDSTISSAGVVVDDPEVLRMEAEAVLGETADLNTLALARMGRSEGVDGMEYRMHVALNDLADLQSRGIYTSYGVAQFMLHSKNVSADGHFSEQYLGKRYSTAKDPYEGDYRLAQKVEADHAAGFDPTGGAVKFVDKNAFSGQRGASKSYDDVVAEWAQQGLQPTTLDDASDNFVVFTRAA